MVTKYTGKINFDIKFYDIHKSSTEREGFYYQKIQKSKGILGELLFQT